MAVVICIFVICVILYFLAIMPSARSVMQEPARMEAAFWAGILALPLHQPRGLELLT